MVNYLIPGIGGTLYTILWIPLVFLVIILPTYFFQKYLNDLIKESFDKFIDFYNKINDIQIVKIDVDSFANAFILFETLNDRGIPLSSMDLIKNKILEKFGPDLIVNSWYDLHKDLYRVMLIERWAAYILLSLIIAVAAFNILSSLTMSVLEKKKDIGVLRSMGTTSGTIKKIFMFEGMLIGVIGTILGLTIGLFICYLQINFNIYPLDASKYVIDTLPVQVKLSDILAVTIMSLLLTFFASKYPANKALKTEIIDAIKWE